MISLMIHLGALPCPAAGYVGSGVKAMSGRSAGGSWLRSHVSRDKSAFVVRTADPMPTADNSTRLSAPPERSP
jgi:hypothetical protein